MRNWTIIQRSLVLKMGDLVKGWCHHPYRPQIGLVIKTDSIWDGNEIKPPMIEVLWSWGKIEKVSSDDLLVINV